MLQLEGGEIARTLMDSQRLILRSFTQAITAFQLLFSFSLIQDPSTWKLNPFCPSYCQSHCVHGLMIQALHPCTRESEKNLSSYMIFVYIYGSQCVRTIIPKYNLFSMQPYCPYNGYKRIGFILFVVVVNFFFPLTE